MILAKPIHVEMGTPSEIGRLEMTNGRNFEFGDRIALNFSEFPPIHISMDKVLKSSEID
jgi:hypothetical protein